MPYSNISYCLRNLCWGFRHLFCRTDVL